MSSPVQTPASADTQPIRFVVGKRSGALTGVDQLDTQWCWAACCEMFVKYNGDVDHSQKEFVTEVMSKEFDKNVCGTPSEFVPKLARLLPEKQIGVREYIKTPPDQRYSHEGIKQMIDGGPHYDGGRAEPRQDHLWLWNCRR